MMDMSDVAVRGTSDGVSRRKSLLALGMAVLAANAANTDVTEAKKKKGKTCKKKEKQRCRKDAATCKPQVAAICGLGPAQCLAAQNCCDECAANGFLTCLIGVTGASVESFASR
ncbi:MAG: hypothetical protein M3Z20_04325 [Chloroflexota bacterium]|nr:hypothetical protein [Chloroflexota bacterium]